MKGIIIDENLPSKLNLPTGLLVRSTRAVGINPTDAEIWEYAKARDFVILTKDADFSHRIAVSTLRHG